MTALPAYWLGPLLLEDGFERDAAGQIVATATRRAHLLIADGRIAELRFDAAPEDGRPRRDARGWLALPAFADMHIHLDKGHYGGPWRAATPFVSVAERIREEQGFLLDFLPDTRRRAEALLDLIAADGVAFARVHCNVDPVAGLATMEQVRLALDSRKHWLDYELVAFPQHGLLSGGTLKLMDQALASGFDVVGGLDPASVDGDIERSLHATLELAVKHGAPVDLHLHERGELGAYTLERLARLSESAGLAGRVSVSHAYCLGELEPARLDQVCAALAASGIAIVSAAPIDVPMPPPRVLAAHGIPLSLGNDNINDHWTPYNSGSIVERASRLGERHGWNDEYSLSRALRHISRGLTPLDDAGRRVWPQVGDAADLTLVDACCSAELIARRKPVRGVLRGGRPGWWAEG